MRNDRLGGPQYANLGLTAPLLKTACKAQAEEAQRKINERRAKRLASPPTRRNLRYPDSTVVKARELYKTMTVGEIAARLNIKPDTIQGWIDGTNRRNAK